MKILVVDDHPSNVELLTQFLETSGYEVRTAANGEQALRAVSQDRPDLVIMDLNMPGLAGWETTQLLKRNPQTQHIPVIVVTADNSRSAYQRAMDVGCTAYHVKPVDLWDLAATISTLLKPSEGKP